MVSLLRHLHGPSKFLGKLVFSNLVMSHFQRYFGGSRYFPVLSRCDVKFWDKFVAPQTATRKQARSQLSPPTRQALLGVRDLGSLPLVAGGTAAATCLEREDHGGLGQTGPPFSLGHGRKGQCPERPVDPGSSRTVRDPSLKGPTFDPGSSMMAFDSFLPYPDHPCMAYLHTLTPFQPPQCIGK